MDQIGKTLVVVGLATAILGGAIWLSSKVSWLRLGRLPGDIAYERDGVSVYFPITTMILASVLFSLVFYIVSWLRR